MAEIDELVVKLSADIAELKSGMLEAARLTQKSADKMDDAVTTFADSATENTKRAASAFEVFKGALAAAGVVKGLQLLGSAFQSAIGTAREFSSGVAEINSILPANAKLTKQNELALIRLSAQYGSTPQKQAKAFYQIVSAGISGIETQTKLLDQANKAAVAGITDVETAINGLTNVMAVYGATGVDATKASDILFTAVKEGKTNFELLSANIGKVAPIAKAAGVSFDELAGTIAFVTKTGISTEETMTGIKAAVQNLAAPTAEMAKTAKAMGIELGEASVKTNGLRGIFDQIRVATGGSLSEIQKFIPSIEAAGVVAAVASGDFEDFERILGETAKASGATDAAFKELEKSADFQLKALQSELAAIFPTMLNLAEGPIAELVKSLRMALPDAVLVGISAVEGIATALQFVTVAFDGLNASIAQSVIRMGAWASAAMALVTDGLSAAKKEFATGQAQIDAIDEALLESINNNSFGKFADGVKQVRTQLEKGMNTEALASTAENIAKNTAEVDKLKNKTVEATTELQKFAEKVKEGLASDTAKTETELIKMQFEERLINEEEYRALQLEKQMEFFEAEQAQLQAARNANELTEEQHAQALKNLAKKNALEQVKIEKELTKAKEAEQQAQLRGLQSTLGQIASLQDTNNKALQTIGKAAAISQATISGIVAVQEALKVGTGIGGPALGFAFAGLVGAATAANVAKIAGVPLQSGIDEVPGPFNQDRFPAILAGGERVVPAETNQDLKQFLQDNANGGARTFNISVNVDGVAFGDEGAAQLIERINEGIEQGVGRIRA